MKTIDLEDLEDWFKKQLQKKYAKEHKLMTSKIFKKAKEELNATKMALRSWTRPEKYEQSKSEGKPIPEKMQKIIERFVEKFSDALDKVEVPGIDIDINYTNCVKFYEQVRNLYQIYNTTGKKTLPRIRNYYNLEIKELDMHLRKIGDYSAKTASFIHKKYPGGKEADQLLRKIPNILHLIDQLTNSKKTYEEMESRIKEMEKNLELNKKQYDELLNIAELKELKRVNEEIRKKERYLLGYIKYGKALKKLRKAMEDNTISVRDVDIEDLRKYIKSPIDELINEGPKTPKLRELLIKVRLILEHPDNPLKIKKEQREKIISNINEIINDQSLEATIQEIIDLRKRKAEIQEELNRKGIEQKRQGLIDKIQTLTIDLEHFGNDLKNKEREYDALLEKVLNSREFLENEIEKQLGKKIKINITIPE